MDRVKVIILYWTWSFDPTTWLLKRCVFLLASCPCSPVFLLSLFNTVPLYSLKYNSQRLNRCNRGCSWYYHNTDSVNNLKRVSHGSIHDRGWSIASTPCVCMQCPLKHCSREKPWLKYSENNAINYSTKCTLRLTGSLTSRTRSVGQVDYQLLCRFWSHGAFYKQKKKLSARVKKSIAVLLEAFFKSQTSYGFGAC